LAAALGELGLWIMSSDTYAAFLQPGCAIQSIDQNNQEVRVRKK
jgi:hypothetical protein